MVWTLGVDRRYDGAIPGGFVACGGGRNRDGEVLVEGRQRNA
jgi:hypothetical protein